jgi:hypothetical protein
MLLIKNSKVYDVVKYITQILIPAGGTLYFALASAWNWSNSTAVLGTVTAVDTFLGVMLGISSTVYNNSDAQYDGHIDVDEDESKVNYSLSLNSDPDDLKNKKAVHFKVRPAKKKK